MSLSLNSSNKSGSRSTSIASLIDDNLGKTRGLGHELKAGRDSIWSQSDNGSISGDFVSQSNTSYRSRRYS